MVRRLAIAFTGSGADLRRQGRRDLLINIVLGGLYTPVARRHAAQYLLRHTSIAGTALALVPVPHSRWPAILLAAAVIALRVANEFGRGPPLPFVIAGGVLLLPFFWRTVAAREIEAVRWRERRLVFAARWPEIYRASGPLLLLGGTWAVAQPYVEAAAPQALAFDLHWIAGALATAAVALPLLACQAFSYRRLRFTRTRVGDAQVTWNARLASYLRLWIVTALAVLATAVAPVLLLRQALFGSLDLTLLAPAQAIAVYAGALVLALMLSAPARAWYEARLFVLCWDGVRIGDALRVACHLDVRAFVALRTADAWRTVATLGWQHPQAVVRAWELKLAALEIRSADASDGGPRPWPGPCNGLLQDHLPT
jgi:uncharacterized membrane protein YjgN (DUF898 family)